MPIPSDQVRTNFIAFPVTATVAEIAQHVQSSGRYWDYLVIRVDDSRFAVFFLADLIQAVQVWRGATLTITALEADLAAVPNLISRFAVEALDAERLNADQAAAALRLAPASDFGRFLAIIRGDQLIGVMGRTYRSAQRIDIHWLEGTPLPVEDQLEETAWSDEPGEAGTAPPEPAPGAAEAPGTLSAGETESDDAAAERFINVELLDNESSNLDPSQAPLQAGAFYSLQFDVDLKLRAAAIVTSGARLQLEHQPEEDVVPLTVRLESSDFRFFNETEQTLYVPQQGKSLNKVKFDFSPLQDGPATITAVFLKQGNFVQVMSLKFHVGALFQVGTLGRNVNEGLSLPPRQVNLTILQAGAGFQLILSGAVAATCQLNITPQHLNALVDGLRKQLTEVVQLTYQGEKVFQTRVDIPEPASELAFKTLAQAGYGLYRSLFFGPGADSQSRNLGKKLSEMARREPLSVQIFSQQFMIPWGLLYIAERWDPEQLEAENFLGLKHVIEHIPLQPEMHVTEGKIAAGGLQVSLNLNRDIDRDMRHPLTQDQVAYWQAIRDRTGVGVTIRETKAELLSALANPDTADQILYLYCHAESSGLSEAGGPPASRLVLSGGQALTLEELYLMTESEEPLAGAPLVFLNACQSAELSPLFYDGFVPYFMAKGARGVIGTECDTPALFAVEWSKRFFEKFLRGRPLGQVFLDLRREFFFKHNNIMGLLYALYVDGDTVITPGLELAEAEHDG